MKVIVKNSVAVLVVEDSATVNILADRTMIDQTVVWDLNLNNAVCFNNVNNVPEDYAPNVYTFDGTSWNAIE